MFDLLKLTKRLYPTGRAFRIPAGGVFEKVHRALIVSEQAALDYAVDRTLDSLLADNDNFTVEDALVWERRLAIITSPDTNLINRRSAILRKYFAPFGLNTARQHFQRIQQELRLAGFDVYVHENLTGISPTVVAGTSQIQHGQFQHGQVNHGSGEVEKVANSINPDVDSAFNTGSNFFSTFFIGGQTFGDFATIPLTRQTEFRQLILQLKPAQTIAFLLITYDASLASDFSLDFNLDFKA